AASLAAKVRLLQNRACQSHLSTLRLSLTRSSSREFQIAQGSEGGIRLLLRPRTTPAPPLARLAARLPVRRVEAQLAFFLGRAVAQRRDDGGQSGGLALHELAQGLDRQEGTLRRQPTGGLG